jgi:hypothetical protein
MEQSVAPRQASGALRERRGPTKWRCISREHEGKEGLTGHSL